MMPETVDVDFAVVGSGIAGLWFGYMVSSKGSVAIITKKSDTESNTNYAQGGIAAALGTDDSPALHLEDTLQAGAGLAHPEVVRVVTESGPELVRRLAEVGVTFSTYLDSAGCRRFDLGREGGHRRRRIVHARDLTGWEIERGLLQAIYSRPNIQLLQQQFALDLVLDRNGCCRGVLVIDQRTGKPLLVRSRVCMLATGGIGQVYLHTTNPPIATGDGIALAFRSGAPIANMEFIQFHPTALYGGIVDGRSFLISEALRGEGAVLRLQDGSTFMHEFHPDASLAPRDVVARAVAAKLRERREDYVLLDATHLHPDRLRERFPTIYRTCLGFGIDITRNPIPVVPAAHYVCGGIKVDLWGRTSIPGLFAAGECACTGLHGANRLASNSLLEALVFADRAAQVAPGVEASAAPLDTFPLPEACGVDEENLTRLRMRLRRLMFEQVGIVRSDEGLARAAGEVETIRKSLISPACHIAARELENMITVATLIITCCRLRPESRGLHYNIDHPEPDERYARDTVITRQMF
ncbi:MAG: L-aspartate oxidase [candidate division WOR-3 bacterium]